MSYLIVLAVGILLGHQIFSPRTKKRRDSWLTSLNDNNPRVHEIDSGKMVSGLYNKRVEISGDLSP